MPSQMYNYYRCTGLPDRDEVRDVEDSIARLMASIGIENTRKMLRLPPHQTQKTCQELRDEWQDSLDFEEFFSQLR